MTKRTALEALHGDLAAEERLLAKLADQEERRRADVVEANEKLSATRAAIRESSDRSDALRAAIARLTPVEKKEETDAAS